MNKKTVAAVSVLIAIISAASLTAWILLKNTAYENPVALIYKDKELKERIELNMVTEPYEIILTGENGESNTISVKYGEIAVTDATCPDRICIRTGSISGGAVPIICLPNHVEIRITEKENGIDAVLF